MTDIAARLQPPIPSSVSEQARQFLASSVSAQESPPALDDLDGWLRYVEQRNQYIMGRFGSREFPGAVDDTEIAGVRTYVLRADGVRDGAETPIYLDIHGGGLIMGGGEACRLMAGA